MTCQRLLSACAAIALALTMGAASADAAVSSTYLGKLSIGDGGPALQGYLDMPRGVAVAANGTIYLADTVNNLIRTISPSGVLGTYSGTGDYGATNGNRQKATWSEPEGIAIDSAGTLYVADTGSSQIRRIRKNIVTTIVRSNLKQPSGVAVSGSTLYIADTGNNRVVTTDTSGSSIAVLATGITAPLKLVVTKTTVYVVSAEKGTVTAINLKTKKKKTLTGNLIEPRTLVWVDDALLVAAGASGIWNELWRIDPASGKKTLIERRRETELLNQTSDMALATINGERQILLVQQGGSSMFSVDTAGGNLRLIAGSRRFQDHMGVRTAARLGRPKTLALAPDQSRLYISYANSNKIAVLDLTTNQVSELSGHVMDNYRESTGTDARFSDISAMVVSPDGATLYVTDRNNQRIRTVDTSTGETRYLTGAGITNLIDLATSQTEQIDQSYKNGYREGAACPTAFTIAVRGCAYFDRPTGLALTRDGKTLYIADASNNRIRKVSTTTGQTSFIAGSGKPAFTNGQGKKASFNGPTALVLSRDEKTLYVTDKYNHAIRAVDLKTKNVSTVAGTGRSGYRDGGFTKAQFSLPEYLTIDSGGNLLITESGGLHIRKLDLKRGVTSLVSGSGKRGFRNAGTRSARWNNPKGIVILGSDALVADSKNDVIRRLDL